jgi:hypothetical protein
MYKNSPPELQGTMLPTLKAALDAAVKSLNQLAGPSVPVPPVAMDAATAIAQIPSSLASVEGAAQMYKNSPPELQGVMLPTLLAALEVCANTLNQASGAAPATVAAPPKIGKPEQVVAPAPAAVPKAPAATAAPAAPVQDAPTGNDANSKFLQKVYSSLEAASGDQKLGLGKLSSDQVRKQS